MFKQVLQNKRKNIHKDNLEHVLKFEKKTTQLFINTNLYNNLCRIQCKFNHGVNCFSTLYFDDRK